MSEEDIKFNGMGGGGKVGGGVAMHNFPGIRRLKMPDTYVK